ncbi:MAG: Rossmann-like and DUF2520 domain-containing protein [Prevotella sp.]
MRIVMIGAGRLASHLTRALYKAGHEIVQVYSRTAESATPLAHAVGAVAVTETSALAGGADLYVLAVKDDALGTLIPKVGEIAKDKVVVHTAGSVPMSVFERHAVHYGVFYPMQTFSKEREVNFADIPCFLEAGDVQTYALLERVAASVSEKVYSLSGEQRRYLHLAAVFACNFVNHCYAVASDLLQMNGIPFDVMYPLIDETAAKVHAMSPVKAQTGPAVRYDRSIIAKQSEMLKDYPVVCEVYDKMSLSIHQKEIQNND